jgi:arginine decarboxylase
MDEERNHRHWSVERSVELYQVDRWGAGAVGANQRGHVVVYPHGPEGPALDLYELIPALRGSGLGTPLLLRFPDLLTRRVHDLVEAFHNAAREYGYRGRYRGVFPIKVNQQRHVVEELVGIGVEAGMGLEVGSKPELLAATAVLGTEGALLICNGYKDRSYIESALLAQQLGRNPILVIDRFEELPLALQIAQELGLAPHLGVRVRLAAKGAGKWADSSGERSKFGLTPAELVAALELLETHGRLACLELLHFHIGSQITAIRAHKDALREATRVWVGLHKMGATPTMLDVGGGLGVDYDGSQTDFHSSMNYSIQEYANDVVAAVLEACNDAGLPHPDLVTEAGRAMVAQHSVLIFDVLGVSQQTIAGAPEALVEEADHRVLYDLIEVRSRLNETNAQEAWHDLQELREEATSLFALGYLDLRGRAKAERLHRLACERLREVVRSLPQIPEDLQDVETALADIYFGNFSMFQSLPDHWGFKQLFPVMPLHRLDEEPTRRGVVADLTCDSDGKIGKFIDQQDVREVLELHAWTGERYYLGVFMVGAYQEILGDMHNLFGDTDAVHVRVDRDGTPSLEHIVAGDTVREVLAYVQFDSTELVERVQKALDGALRTGRIDHEQAARILKQYKSSLEDTTYLST